MTTTPFAQVQVSVNGGAQQSGAITVAANQTIQLSGVNTTGWQAQTWELYDAPPGFNPGGAWSLEPDGITWQNTKLTPDSFSTGTVWGKWMVRLRVNGNPLSRNADGSPNAAFTQQLTDEATILRFPSAHGLQDTGFLETSQASKKGFVGDVQGNWRAIDTSLLTVVHITSGNSPFAPVPNSLTVVDCSGGNVVVNLPMLAQSQFCWVLQDASTLINAHTITVNAASGQTLNRPSPNQSTFVTSSTDVNNVAVELRWINAGSSGSPTPLLLY